MEYIEDLDIILARIKEPVLSPFEEETIHPIVPSSLKEKYTTLQRVLHTRGDVGNSQQKLSADASINGISLESTPSHSTQIVIGAGL